MRSAALVFALGTASLTGCAAVALTQGGPDPHDQLQDGALALESGDYAGARSLLAPLYDSYWTQPVGQHAMLALIASELDTRNPDRDLSRAADRAARLLNVEQLEPWAIPVAESFYLLALELGAGEEELVAADSAQQPSHTRHTGSADARRMLPAPPMETVPARIGQIEAERDELRQRLARLEQRLAEREATLLETTQELERIKRTIKP